jgi:hypothetical protein
VVSYEDFGTVTNEADYRTRKRNDSVGDQNSKRKVANVWK